MPLARVSYLAAFAATLATMLASCASRESFGTRSMAVLGPGIVNDPKNRSLRFDLLKFGLDTFCAEMQSRGLALKLSDDQPVMGRFYASSCSTQVIDDENRKSFVVQYAGAGYASSPQGGRVGFSTTGLAEYSPDFMLHEGAMYVYFRPRVVDATAFQTLLVESELANSVLKLFGVDANAFGKKVIDGQLRRGFSVIRKSETGETDFGQGIIALGDKPYHPYSVSSEDKKMLANERTEVHVGQQDFIGPLDVADDDQALYFTASVDGAPLVDAILVPESSGRVMLDALIKRPGGAAVVQPSLLDEALPRGTPWKRFVPVAKGRYYLLIDNSSAAGRSTPPQGPADGLSARVDVLVLAGDRP